MYVNVLMARRKGRREREGGIFIHMGAKRCCNYFQRTRKTWLAQSSCACDVYDRDVGLWLERPRHRLRKTRLTLRTSRNAALRAMRVDLIT
jgi:hypothetical protein